MTGAITVRRMDAWGLVKRNIADAFIVAIAVASLIEIAVSVVPSSKLSLAVMTVASDACLLLHRRFPFGAPLAATAVIAVASFFVASGLRALAVPVLGAIVAGWLMGYGNDRRRAVIGLFLQYGCVQIDDGQLRPARRGRHRLHLAADRGAVARRPDRARSRGDRP